MTTKLQPRWGIVSLAIIMFLVTLIITAVNGGKASLYLFLWMMIGYYAYKGRLPEIKTWMMYAIVINIAALALMTIFMDSDSVNYVSRGGKRDLIAGVLVMLVPKIFLYLYCNKQLEESNENKTTQIVKDLNFTTQEVEHPTPSKPIKEISMEDAHKRTLPSQSSSKNELNFQIANQTITKVEIDEGTVWADIYKEFDSDKRNIGLWARLFSQNEGNETKAKAEYLKVRFDSKVKELKEAATSSQETAIASSREDYLNRKEEVCIKDKVFDLYTSSGYEVYVFPNGNAAYKRFKIYKIYESKEAAINAIKIYLRTEVVGRTGFIRDLREEDL